ncbi:MAG TPA: formate dehydrogenase accessory sulfurtransferase FdhD [Thermoanaerobaculia bacterium]|jgi:FdhD protein|nr:formate dehydrogenase accessory sulfurtransferase FdhD [Thermoanaerobaculia bacterium]
MAAPTETWPITFVVDGARQELPDAVVVEDPLEILVAIDDAAASTGAPPAPLAVTLRTPGHDRELVAGLLYAEGIVDGAADIASLDEAAPGEAAGSRVVARLTARRTSTTTPARPFLSTAACGVCGKASVDAVFAGGFPPLPAGPRVPLSLLLELPGRMAPAQQLFASTGGLHAAALFDARGELLLLREDVGRHNAVDKLVGALLLAGQLPAGERLLAVSGRIGFEIVQKALRAGIPLLVAVGAPSTLALRLAARAGMTVAGFVRPGRCNLYCGAERVLLE